MLEGMRNNGKTKFIETCKGEEIVETHYRQRPEDTQKMEVGEC